MPNYVEQVIYRVTLPMPPSVNNWLMKSKTGELINTPQWRTWKVAAIRELKAKAADQVLAQLGTTPFKLKIVVNCWFDNRQSFNKNDADNRLKAAQDAICAAMGIDDNEVYEALPRLAGFDPWEPAHINIVVLALIGDIAEGLGDAYEA